MPPDVPQSYGNEALTDDERNAVKIQRAAAVEELALLDAEIALAELEIESEATATRLSSTTPSALRKRRRQLHSLISSCDIALAPYKYLPSELLSVIFSLTFIGFPTYLPPTRHRSPLALCHTCSRWRTVSLATPSLWTDIVFTHSSAQDPYTTMNLAEEWYTRSGSTQPLSLAFSHWSWPTLGERKDCQQLMKDIVERLVIPHATRFRHLDLCLPETHFLSLFTKHNLSLPRLESISLVQSLVYDHQHDPDDKPVLGANSSVLRNATRLKVVELRGFQTIDDNIFKWSKLTHFTCLNTRLHINQVHSILRRCTQIAECRFVIYGGVKEDAPRPVDLPRLRRLDVQFDYYKSHGNVRQCIQVFFDPFILKNLKELNLSYTASWQPQSTTWPQSALMDLLTRSCCALEILQMDGIPLESDTLQKLIEELPTLSALRIGVDKLLPTDVLYQMADVQGDSSNNVLLPKLECLVCLVDDLEAAIQMLEHRWEASQAGSDVDHTTIARPTFIMLEYMGCTIQHQQAVRVDRLRANGVEIDMSRPFSVFG